MTGFMSPLKWPALMRILISTLQRQHQEMHVAASLWMEVLALVIPAFLRSPDIKAKDVLHIAG
jgi:hypothetical protein